MATQSAPTTPVTANTVACGASVKSYKLQTSSPYFSSSPNGSLSTYLDDSWEIPFESVSDLKWIAAGSQGAVFKGIWKGEVIAVKKVKTKEETEIKHLLCLNHRNVMRFYGICTQAPCFSLFMEYCGKGQLFHLIQKGHKIDKECFCEWSRQIADGMQYLHSKKIIHRDLKSPNILVNDEYVLKICDFGVSHIWDKQKSTVMSFCGTPSWMAPEIIKKEPCSEKVDIWSFGVVLWELLTTEAPYKDVDSLAIIYGVGANKLSLPIPPMAPDGIKLLLRQCWSMKPSNRPSFNHILTHVSVFKSEVSRMSKEEWAVKTQKCKEFVIEVMKNIPQDGKIKSFTNCTQLKQRLQENLRHVKDIRELYHKKIKRADKMCLELKSYFQKVNMKEQALCQKERQLRELEVRICNSRSSANTSGTTHKRNHNLVQKNVVVRADHNLINGSVNSGKQNVHPYVTGHTLADDNDDDYLSSSEDESSIQRNTMNRHSGLSVYSFGGQPSFYTCDGFNRQSSMRSLAGSSKQIHGSSPSRIPVLTSERSFSRDSSFRYSNGSFHNVSDLRRGSSARNSGNSEFSNDSGIHLHCADGSLSNVDLTIECSHCGQPVRSAYIHCNADGSNQDGKLTFTRRKKSRRSSSGFLKEHSQNLTRLKDHHLKNSPGKQSLHNLDSSNNIVAKDHGKDSESDFKNGNYSEKVTNDFGEKSVITELSPPLLRQSTSYEEAIHCEAHNAKNLGATCSPFMLEQHASQSGKDSSYPDSGPSSEDSDIDNNDYCNGNNFESSLDLSSCTDSNFDKIKKVYRSGNDSERSNKVLFTSVSTNTSSLERSLEMTTSHSDELSDQERKVQAVKNILMAQARTPNVSKLETFI
uniref:Protein kinase domain-containing protein n=1 Tax=Syphacia muris TaxID=451379 RepID=A0A158R4Q7_9BILA